MVEVFFNDNVIETITVLNQIGKGFEWSGELYGEIVSNLIIIKDLLILKQVVSSIGINSGIDKQKRSELRHESLYHYAKTGRLKRNQMVGWIHSHDDLTAFLSATDRSQVEDIYLQEIPFLISIVISSKSKIYKRRRFGFVKKEKKLPFTMKMWFDGKFKNRKYIWFAEKIKPGKNFSFTVLNNEIPQGKFNLIKTDYDRMVEKMVCHDLKNKIPNDRSILSDYFA